MRSRSFGSRLLVIVAFGLALRIAYTIGVADDAELKGDARYYHDAANLLADGYGFTDPVRLQAAGRQLEITTATGATKSITLPDPFEVPTAAHPPFFVVYLAAFSKVGVDSILGHRLASALLGSVSVALAGLTGRALLRGRPGADAVGLVAAALTAGYGFIWINDGLVMSETAAIVVAFGATLVGLRFAREPTARNAAWFGAIGALAALTRAELVLYLPILAAVSVLRAPLAWRDRLLRYLIAGVVALALISPWVIRNLVVFEEPVFLSNGAGTVLVQTNCDATYGGRLIGYWELACGEPQPYGPNGEILDESQRDKVVRQRALDYIGDHRQRLITTVVPRRIGRMWGVFRPLQQIDLDVIFETRSRKVETLAYVQYLVLAPCAVAGAVLSRRQRLPLLAAGLWAVLATITSASTFGNTRYRTAAEVSIVLLASVAIVAAAERWVTIRARRSTRTSLDQAGS